jgi:hypothetical protein
MESAASIVFADVQPWYHIYKKRKNKEKWLKFHEENKTDSKPIKKSKKEEREREDNEDEKEQEHEHEHEHEQEQKHDEKEQEHEQEQKQEQEQEQKQEQIDIDRSPDRDVDFSKLIRSDTTLLEETKIKETSSDIGSQSSTLNTSHNETDQILSPSVQALGQNFSSLQHLNMSFSKSASASQKSLSSTWGSWNSLMFSN